MRETPGTQLRDPAAVEAAEGVEGSWGFTTGDEIAPGFLAWELLGEGRRYETWLAWDVRRWCPVALKILRRERVHDQRARAGLGREARTVGSLEHPAIQRLLEARLDEAVTLPYLAFEYLEGPTLDELIGSEGKLDPPDVVRLGLQVASALHYVHGEGIVHLDLKPANLVVRDGRVVLLDFDIALPIGGLRSRTTPRGTGAFMPPEQVRCAPASPAMDVWALGAVLYEAATDLSAFEVTGTGEARVYPQLTKPVPFPRSIDPSIPQALDHAIRRLMDPDPSRRPATGAAALDLLRSALPPGEEGLWPDWTWNIVGQPTRNGGRRA